MPAGGGGREDAALVGAVVKRCAGARNLDVRGIKVCRHAAEVCSSVQLSQRPSQYCQVRTQRPSPADRSSSCCSLLISRVMCHPPALTQMPRGLCQLECTLSSEGGCEDLQGGGRADARATSAASATGMRRCRPCAAAALCGHAATGARYILLHARATAHNRRPYRVGPTRVLTRGAGARQGRKNCGVKGMPTRFKSCGAAGARRPWAVGGQVPVGLGTCAAAASGTLDLQQAAKQFQVGFVYLGRQAAWQL